jgi:acyl-CoA thioester hydrolase
MQLSYEYQITVRENEIDEFNHVNNEVYLKWLIQVAASHSESLGYNLEKFLSDGAAFVVRRHELDYLSPAFLGEELVIETWLSSLDRAKSVRETRIKRKSDGKVILMGKTLWVYIDLKLGKPKEIPPSMAECYRKYLHRSD